MMERGLEIIYFPITIFPIRAVFLATSRKRMEQPFPQNLNIAFQYLASESLSKLSRHD